jgi:BRCA1/BRCA2-containing complex subunit 3
MLRIGVQDRVEVAPQQMAATAQLAEVITQETGQRTRIIGWYHSHPHITVLPSHVDVATQVMPLVIRLADYNINKWAKN